MAPDRGTSGGKPGGKSGRARERDDKGAARRKGQRVAPSERMNGARTTRRSARACFRIGASAVIVHEERVLLARRRDIGWWNLPGGGVEPGETAEEGLRREVREEVRAKVEIVRLVGVYSKPQKDEVVLTFLCALAEGQLASIGTSDEVSEVGWFARDTLPDDLLPKHRQRVLDALAGQREAFLRDQRTSTEQDQQLDVDETSLV